MLQTVNTILNDDTCEEARTWREKVQKTNILSVLGDHEDMMKARQKELNSLKEMVP